MRLQACVQLGLDLTWTTPRVSSPPRQSLQATSPPATWACWKHLAVSSSLMLFSTNFYLLEPKLLKQGIWALHEGHLSTITSATSTRLPSPLDANPEKPALCALIYPTSWSLSLTLSHTLCGISHLCAPEFMPHINPSGYNGLSQAFL